MKKKGFTLIELLAVIVILAIITVIAVPKILDVIEKSEEQTFIDGVKLIENGIKDGLHTATECVVDIGKSISGIFTGKFENISQVQTAIGSGGVIDTFSDLIDKASNKIYQKGIINSQIKSVITGGKDIILNNVTSNIKNEMNFQERSIHNIGKYVDNFNEYLKSKDFEGMTKEWKKIQNNLKSIIPLENILKQVRQTENIYNLIKNNGNNFELSQEELEIIKKI